MFFWNLLGILFGFGEEEEEGDGRAEIDPNG
jgi:hypothetical protein